MARRFLWTIPFALVIALLTAGAPAQAKPFHLSDPARLPFLPRIEKDDAPALCAAVKKSIQRSFVKTGMALLDETIETVPFRKRSFGKSDGGYEKTAPIAELDYDNDGTEDVLARRDSTTGGTLRAYRFLFRFPNMESLVKQIETDDGYFGMFHANDGRSYGSQLMGLGQFDEGFYPFLFSGKAYFYIAPQLDQEINESVLSIQLHSHVVRYDSAEEITTLCAFRISHPLSEILAANSLKLLERFVIRLRAIRGESNCSRGSSHPHVYLNNRFGWVSHALSVAPWRFQSFPHGLETMASENIRTDPEHDRAATLRFLSDWAEVGIWNFRTFQDLDRLERNVIAELARYYVKAFGYDETGAKDLAQRATTALLTQTLITPSYYAFDPANRRRPADPLSARKTLLMDELRSALASPREITRLLERALLHSSISFDQISALIDRGASLDGTVEPVFFFAAGNTYHMGFLLQRGVDINVTNAFGKTALMYAAQLGQSHSVEFLLKHGADTNLTTRPLSSCGAMDYAIGIGGRTALMYAAENASAKTIEMLVKAGANRTAQDTQGRRAIDYLALNWRLSKSDLREATLILAEAVKPAD